MTPPSGGEFKKKTSVAPPLKAAEAQGGGFYPLAIEAGGTLNARFHEFLQLLALASSLLPSETSSSPGVCAAAQPCGQPQGWIFAENGFAMALQWGRIAFLADLGLINEVIVPHHSGVPP